MEIDRLVDSFFALFSNRNGARPNLDGIFELFVPQGIIAKIANQEAEISTLKDFISPRLALLTEGVLTDFSETETSQNTLIFDKLAQRVSTYQKSGRLRGEWFSAHGIKTFQFIRTRPGWRILSMAWDDEQQPITNGVCAPR